MPSTTSSIVINRARLLERFLRYVRIDTTADPNSDTYPSSACQRDLGSLISDELTAMSINDAHLDENGLVWGTVPSTLGEQPAPTVALVSHLDTSPEAPGRNVNPQVIENYDGQDITLPSGLVISVDESPELRSLAGTTLITTDGTTLLGGDDKAGVAIMMELAETLVENPHLAHGPVRLLFTCDEEIGHGTDKINLSQVDSLVAYTIDGGGAGVIDVETFSADGATVRFVGNNIHPSIAKNRMVNALRAAADFVSKLPRDRDTPETTDDRQGFLHAHSMRGSVAEATVELILRSFDSDDLSVYAQQIKTLANQIADQTPGLRAEVTITRQYRNMRDGIESLPESVTIAEQAFANLGRPCQRMIIRGGTDGSQLTEKGLPTPNLSSGQHNLHSLTEYACLDEMVEAIEHLIEMLKLWSEVRS